MRSLVLVLLVAGAAYSSAFRSANVRSLSSRRLSLNMVTSAEPPLTFLKNDVIKQPFDDSSFYNEVDDDASAKAEVGTLTPEQSQALQLNSIMKAIPQKAFEKSLFKSLAYMFFDYAMWGGSFLAMLTLVHSPVWAAMALWQKVAASAVYWNVAGFFMWCIFVVGHDCGHTNFSKHKLLNDIIGHITHGSIMVPYFPWQVCSHLYYSIQ
jgi:hypothetical protein